MADERDTSPADESEPTETPAEDLPPEVRTGNPEPDADPDEAQRPGFERVLEVERVTETHERTVTEDDAEVDDEPPTQGIGS